MTSFLKIKQMSGHRGWGLEWQGPPWGLQGLTARDPITTAIQQGSPWGFLNHVMVGELIPSSYS